ncbi:MAG: PEP-CTERM sorting domain-containing protein [Pirellulales bacterium]|nr:PEP-CTERM sorting domain-containing protein [Pirellulales bacterium]
MNQRVFVFSFFLALVCLPASLYGQWTDWYENFDSYTNGQNLQGVNGWKGWDNTPANAALVSNVYSSSAPNSVAIESTGPTDLVHEYSTPGTGLYIYSADTYVPFDSIGAGSQYFILLNVYNDGASAQKNWALQQVFNFDESLVSNADGLGISTTILYDEWVTIRVEINLDTNTKSLWYGDTEMFTAQTWASGGAVDIGAVDLWNNGAAVMYYDNMSLVYDQGTTTGILTINRETGAMTLKNDTAQPMNMALLSIRSDAGAFEPANWTSIAGNYDSAGNGTVSSDEWLLVSESPDELCESTLGIGTLDPGEQVNLGTAWGKYYRDLFDVHAEYLDTNTDTVLKIKLDFVGNDGASFEYGDLNFDGAINVTDWGLYRSGLGGSFTGQYAADTYQIGDMDGDLDNDLADFRLFEGAYDAANGAGALAALIPEPNAFVLLALGGLVALAIRRRRFAAMLATFVIAIALTAVTTTSAQTTDTFDVPGTPRTDRMMDRYWIPGPEIISGGWDAGGPMVMRLTTINSNQNNQIGYDLTDPGVYTTTTINFEYRMTAGSAIGGAGRADGLGVVLLNTDNFGDTGTIPSFTSEEPNIAGSLGVALDIYNNGESDINSNNTVSIHYPGFTTQMLDVTGLGLDLADGVNHSVQINVSTPQVVSGNGTVEVLIDSINIFSGPVSIPGMLAYEGRLLMAGRTGGENALTEVDNIDVQWSTPTGLSLQVNTTTGATSLMNISGEAIPLNGYQITSASGLLDPTSGGWSSLQNQDYEGNGSPGAGNGWEEGGSISASSIAEAYLLGSSTLAIGGSIAIGNPFDGGLANQDLVFQYSIAGGRLLTGSVEYFAGPGENADFNSDSVVDGNDFLIWQIGLGLTGQTNNSNGDANGDGTVNGDDLAVWKSQFGTGGAAGGAAGSAIPEPGTLGLFGLLLAGLTVGFFRRISGASMMNISRIGLIVATIALITFTQTAMAGYTLDRQYRLGDADGASAGQSVYTSNDSYVTAGGDKQDLENILGVPKYVNVSTIGGGRPGASAGELGVRFSGAANSYLTGARLGSPADSAASSSYNGTPAGPLNYTNIYNRGYQGWVYPEDPTGGLQDILFDTLGHGLRISWTGTWVMHYWGPDGYDVNFDTGIPVTSEWHHFQVVRTQRFGTPNRGSMFFLDGKAVAFGPGGYWDGGTNIHPLILGANCGDNDGTEALWPDAGTENFFVGVLDEVELFVLDTQDITALYGVWNPAVDNPFIAAEWGTIQDGDINKDGNVNDADVNLFIANWRSVNYVTGGILGDGSTRAKGDFNWDGLVDPYDWVVLRDAYAAAGGGNLDLDALLAAAGVPEPSTGALLLFGLVAAWLIRRR